MFSVCVLGNILTFYKIFTLHLIFPHLYNLILHEVWLWRILLSQLFFTQVHPIYHMYHNCFSTSLFSFQFQSKSNIRCYQELDISCAFPKSLHGLAIQTIHSLNSIFNFVEIGYVKLNLLKDAYCFERSVINPQKVQTT